MSPDEEQEELLLAICGDLEEAIKMVRKRHPDVSWATIATALEYLSEEMREVEGFLE